MKDDVQTKEQLILELEDLRRKITELEKSETERKRVEESLRESEEKYRLITDNSNDWIYLISLDGKFQYVSPSSESLTGYSSVEFTNDPGLFLNIIHPDDKELVKSHLEIVPEETKAHNLEFRIINKEGKLRWIRHSCLPVHNNQGQYVGRSGTNRDITERKRIEDALRKSEEKYRSILETIEDGYYEVDLAGNLTFFNDALTRIHGYPREELIGKNNRQYTDEEDAREMYRNFNQVYHTGQPSKGTHYEIITKKEERKALETSVSLIRDPSGQPIGFRGITRDITELRQTQKALADSEQRFRAVAESSNDFIFEWNLKSGQMEWYGQATEKFKDLLSEIPQTITAYQKIVHPEDLDRLIAATQQNLKKQGSFLEEYRIIGKGGQTIYLRSAGTCLRNENGKPYKWIGALSDITERKKREEALKTLSIKDDLTGLYNRRGFFALAEQGLKTAQRMGTEMLLIYGDLDNLKEINDTFGHKEGDQALLVISQILKETFRESDILARIGGDEFVMLAMNSLETSAEKLINRFEQVLNDHHLQTKLSHKLAMSFGIACFNPQKSSSIDALLVEADKLMYENKQKKVDRFRIFTEPYKQSLMKEIEVVI